MNKLLPLLFLLFISCQSDELVIIKANKAQITKVPDQGKLYEVSDEGKDCPPCPGNSYCNRKTGKCEGVAVDKDEKKEVIQKKGPLKEYNLQGKPLSGDRFVWMDHGGPESKYAN